MLRRLGIETRLQWVITAFVVALVVVTTLGGSGGAPWTFFTYRTLLVAIAILSAIGSWHADFRIGRVFFGCTVLLFALMLISVLRIQGSHFEGFYLWFKYAFFAFAFISFAKYARYQSSGWKAFVLGTVVAVNLSHLVPDLVLRHSQVVGFSANNANYFAAFLLIGLAATLAAAIFGTAPAWRAAAAVSGAVVLFGILKTGSRGATLASIAVIAVAAIRARGRVSRQVWLAAGLLALLAAVVYSPFLIRKFVDRGETDPYNYARTEVWLGSLQVIAHNPILGVGFGQFFHISKRFTLPVTGTVARYLKRAQMAHSEYLQHMAELGIPAALLLFLLLGYLVYLAWRRAQTVWPEFRCFHEAALLTAAGVGVHALVDNCWTIPVTAASIVVLSLADLLPLRKEETPRRWRASRFVLAGLSIAVIYIFSTLIPGLGLYYNDLGHRAYDRDDFRAAERLHLKAIALAPNHPLFLDNLGMVYLQEFSENGDPKLLAAARLYFVRAIDAMPQALDPHIHMETVLMRSLSGNPGRDGPVYREIVRFDTQLLEIDPYIPFVRKNLASAYYNLGQPEHGMKELETAIDYEPNYVPGYLQLAAWYDERGDAGASRRYTNEALSIVNKYRDFKPTEVYEGVLLGRPPPSAAVPSGQNH